MPGLVPGIHVLCRNKKNVDGRDKPGHDAKFCGRPEPQHSQVRMGAHHVPS